MKTLITIMAIALMAFGSLQAQTVSGKIYGVTEESKKEVLPGVNIYWAYSLQGTTSDIQGNFKITLSRNSHVNGKDAHKEHPNQGHDESDSHNDHLLVFSFIGYQKDTIHVHENMKQVEIVLEIRRIPGRCGNSCPTKGFAYFAYGPHPHPKYFGR